MGCRVIVSCLCFILASVRGTELNLTSEWQTNIGWDVTCSWRLPSNDSLLSVRLFNNDQQFLIFRPETDGGSRNFITRRLEDMLTVNCVKSSIFTGTCVLTLELYQPQRDGFTVACEVSGERPMFMLAKKTIYVDNFVPPSAAVLEDKQVNKETGRVMLNCTSDGIPAPNLVWTIGTVDQKIPHDFTGRTWNATSKLWNVWSALSFTPSKEHETAICTPEAGRGSQLVKGHPAVYSSTWKPQCLTSIILASIFLLLLI